MNLLQKRSLGLLHFQCPVTISKGIVLFSRIGSPWAKLYQVPAHTIVLFQSQIQRCDFQKSQVEGELNVIHGDHAVPDTQYDIEKVEVGSYIGCLYDRQWYVGLVRDLSFEHNDVNVKFMHPKGPAKAVFWPDREDNCWVPVDHILAVVQAPQVNRSGRSYTLEEWETEYISQAYTKLVTNFSFLQGCTLTSTSKDEKVQLIDCIYIHFSSQYAKTDNSSKQGTYDLV